MFFRHCVPDVHARIELQYGDDFVCEMRLQQKEWVSIMKFFFHVRFLFSLVGGPILFCSSLLLFEIFPKYLDSQKL